MKCGDLTTVATSKHHGLLYSSGNTATTPTHSNHAYNLQLLSNQHLPSVLFVSVDPHVWRNRNTTKTDMQLSRPGPDLSSCRTLCTVCPLMMNTSVMSSVNILQE